MLIIIIDISKWETNNVTNMSFMFSGCSSLSFLPDISKWNTYDVTDMSGMFHNCSSLLTLPDISKWNTNSITDLSDMFDRCSSLPSYDFSKIYLTKSLSYLTDIYKISIQTLKGKTMIINCIISDTIQNIKYKIGKKENIPLDLLLLFFDGKQLEDNKTLRDYNIKKNSIIHLARKKSLNNN